MSSPDSQAVEVCGRTISLSHPDKVFFPGIGASKLDLVAYYLAVAEAILGATRGRPAMLQRFPDGALGKSFFQKRVPPGAPEWLQTLKVSTPNGTTSRALVLADMAHVIWAVNLGCLGFHLWPFRVEDPNHADELRIDLDPQPGVGFEMVREAADSVRSLLCELGITAYPKTSGNRGLHVYARLEDARWDSFEVRAAAVALARELSGAGPSSSPPTGGRRNAASGSSSTTTRTPPTRPSLGLGRHGARAGGQVSTPLSWEETASVDPDELTIATVPDRLGRLGDPWAPMVGSPQSLEPLLEMAAHDRAAGLRDAPWPPQYPKQPDEPSRVAPSRARKD